MKYLKHINILFFLISSLCKSQIYKAEYDCVIYANILTDFTIKYDMIVISDGNIAVMRVSSFKPDIPIAIPDEDKQVIDIENGIIYSYTDSTFQKFYDIQKIPEKVFNQNSGTPIYQVKRDSDSVVFYFDKALPPKLIAGTIIKSNKFGVKRIKASNWQQELVSYEEYKLINLKIELDEAKKICTKRKPDKSILFTKKIN